MHTATSDSARQRHVIYLGTEVLWRALELDIWQPKSTHKTNPLSDTIEQLSCNREMEWLVDIPLWKHVLKDAEQHYGFCVFYICILQSHKKSVPGHNLVTGNHWYCMCVTSLELAVLPTFLATEHMSTVSLWEWFIWLRWSISTALHVNCLDSDKWEREYVQVRLP